MIEPVTWANAHLHGDALAQQHRLRHRLFIEHNHWAVPTYDGMEYDQFDTPAAVYLLQRAAHGEVQGVARLIPTTRPYMLKDLWPELLGGEDIPSDPTVWEATRFGVDRSLSLRERGHIVAEIVLGCLEFGLMAGIQRYLVLMPPLIVRRSIGGLGCAFRFLGTSEHLTTYPVAAAEIRVNRETLELARHRAGIDHTILATDGEQVKAA